MDVDMIEMRFTTATGYIRRPCHVCGGTTEKVNVLVEAEMDGPYSGLRCCEYCLKAGDIDGRLAEYASSLEKQAAGVRALIGRLKVPTYAEWQAYEKRVDVAREVAYRRQYDHDFDDTYYKIMADDEVYAKWQRQLEQENDDHNRQLEHQRSRRELLGIPDDVDDDCPF